MRSFSYLFMDITIISCLVYGVLALDPLVSPKYITFPHPFLYRLARFSLWSFYGFMAGLSGTGLWVIAHECGHQAFSPNKTVNNVTGWFLHSSLGIPYHSWRIVHGQHHAHTNHLAKDTSYVPLTRTEHIFTIPAFDSTRENLAGSYVADSLRAELWEALGDSPISAFFCMTGLVTLAVPLHLIFNVSGQRDVPKWTNFFNPFATALYKPAEFRQIIISDIGVLLWVCAIVAWAYTRGLYEAMSLYFVPYLWVNHWLVLVTFLQHTDPLLPHYRAPAFTFPRGALTTLNRSFMGGPGLLGSMMGFVGAIVLHGIAETHVAHHIASKIPHYHAWEANAAVMKRLAQDGICLEGMGGVTWGEAIRVFRECKFIEDTGDVVFYKNARGLAKRVAVFNVGGSGRLDGEVDRDIEKTK